MRPAVFLDRDGTLNREVDYLADPDRFELLPRCAEGLRALAEAGWLLCVVTNQSGIARGLLDEPCLQRIHERMGQLLADEGVVLDWIGHCPHHPDHGPPDLRRTCSCRKPRPGLLEQAAQELDVDLSRSWVVGDSARDLQAGAALGCPGVLVTTGKGEATLATLQAAGTAPDHWAGDLLGAARIILGTGNSPDSPS